MRKRRKWYVAVKLPVRSPRGKAIWRLYVTKGPEGAADDGCPLGDFEGPKGLGRIRRSFRQGSVVEAYRLSRRQVAFWVGEVAR